MIRRVLRVQGIVQGVGFRPTVARMARDRCLTGHVRNTPRGVRIEVQGPTPRVQSFADALQNGPLAALIDRIDTRDAPPEAASTEFCIVVSQATGQRQVWLTPDLAICEPCLQELRNPEARRYRYPFISCAQCGPRYSILQGLPFDRERTVMREFPLCAACTAEYQNPDDRRHHAQITACPDCGPQLSYRSQAADVPAEEAAKTGHAALQAAVAAVAAGHIVAVMGLGGFQLICDASRPDVIARLRARKHRPHKPFAVMVETLQDAEQIGVLDPAEQTPLAGPIRPIVLVRRRQDPRVHASVAPHSPLVGLMLPTTGLHHLLLEALGGPVICTSGNLSGEPICTQAADARHRLAGIADGFLVHDRPILRPVDDAVMRVIGDVPTCLRIGRGLAPLTFPDALVDATPCMATGGHMKTTVAVSVDRHVVVSQHIGDLDTVESRRQHQRTLSDLRHLYGLPTQRPAHDLHPDYATTAALADAPDATGVQHHAAHIASCALEHHIDLRTQTILGLAWDGTGYGTDGTLWGGELLRLGEGGWDRVASLLAFPLPGGTAAITDPRRAALGARWISVGSAALDESWAPAWSTHERRALCATLEHGQSAQTGATTSAVGRLFDVVAALLGLATTVTFEGQAAMQVEYAAMRGRATAPDAAPYPVGIEGSDGLPRLDWRQTLDGLVADPAHADVRAARFEATLVHGALQMLDSVSATPQTPVALTGGCFQNAWLTCTLAAALRARGHVVLQHRRVPPNDGGLAAGQLLLASLSRRAAGVGT